MRELDYALASGRYVGIPDNEEDFDFPTRFSELTAELEAQMQEEAQLNQVICKNLAKIKVTMEVKHE